MNARANVMNSRVTAEEHDLPRADLLCAQIERGRAREAMSAAIAASDRANELLTAAEARLANFAALDRDIERDTAARISAWATTGGEQPSLSPSDKFVEPLRRRAECLAHVDAARAAAETLGTASKAAARKYVEAENLVSHFATLVMVDVAKGIAAELRERRAAVLALERSLSAIGGMWLPNIGGVPRPVPLTPEILEARDNREPPWRSPQAPNPEGERWKSFRAALLADPEATY